MAGTKKTILNLIMHQANLSIIFIFVSLSGFGQNINGRWISVDDASGQPRSVIEIFEQSGKVYGKVLKIFNKPGEDPDPICDKCADDDLRHNKKIIGMEIIQNMIKEENEFSGGQILDPENGKVYRCKLWIEEKVLKVRGYWGPFFRTQTWHRESSRP